MSDYSDDLAGAVADIKESGRAVTLVKKTAATAFNPLNSTITPAAPEQVQTFAVFTAYKAKDIDGEIIKRGDKKCLIAGPVDADVVIDGTKRWSIVSVEAIDPGDGGAILSKLQVRK